MLETLLLAATISMQVKADYYCYMQAPNGQIIDMAYMCPPPPILEKPETEGSAQEATPQLTGAELQEALDLASTLHADAYCEARARGGTNRQADDAATSVLADYLFSSGISADSLTPEFFADSQGRSELLCPELQPTGRYDWGGYYWVFCEPLEKWQPLGAVTCSGEVIYAPVKRLTDEWCLELSDTHPLFTGRCPNCEMPLHEKELPRVHWDCEHGGWIND